MDSLPSEVISLISSSLAEAEKAMFSFTNKTYHEIIPRSYPLLDSCIISRNVKWLKLAEEWGNRWTDSSFMTIGRTDNLGFFTMFLCEWNSSQIDLIVTAAVQAGRTNILKHIGPVEAQEHKRIRLLAIQTAASSRNFHILELYTHNWLEIISVSIKTKDAELYEWVFNYYPGLVARVRCKNPNHAAWIQEQYTRCLSL
jgi:hypothetical protein